MDILSNTLSNPELYIETFFKIRTKDQKIENFKLNPVQKNYLRYRSNNGIVGKGQRDVINKGRQHGFTTLKVGEYLHDTLTNQSTTSVIVGHDDEAMSKVLQSARMMHASLPDELRPILGGDNKHELYFPELESRIWISTYRKLKLRSQTINNILMTEVAFWDGKDVGDKVAGMSESVPIDGNISFESTPNGVGGYFWEQVKSAKAGNSIYQYLEYPWFLDTNYRIARENWHRLPRKIKLKDDGDFELDEMEISLIEKYHIDIEQIMWRRFKMLSMEDMRINEKGIRFSRRFAQEYECSFAQSGSPVFDASYLVPSTVYQKPLPGKRYVHGGDTAEGLDDGDYNVLYTMDIDTGEVVHKERGHWKPGQFAERVHKVGMEYGGLVGVEINNTGHAVLLKLVELWDQAADECIMKGGSEYDVPYRIYADKKRYGWYTSSVSRPIMFAELEESLREGDIKLAYEDENGIEELVSCQFNSKGKPEAPVGMHDDCVIALGICKQMTKYYSFYFKKTSEGGVQSI